MVLCYIYIRISWFVRFSFKSLCSYKIIHWHARMCLNIKIVYRWWMTLSLNVFWQIVRKSINKSLMLWMADAKITVALTCGVVEHLQACWAGPNHISCCWCSHRRSVPSPVKLSGVTQLKRCIVCILPDVLAYKKNYFNIQFPLLGLIHSACVIAPVPCMILHASRCLRPEVLKAGRISHPHSYGYWLFKPLILTRALRPDWPTA